MIGALYFGQYSLTGTAPAQQVSLGRQGPAGQVIGGPVDDELNKIMKYVYGGTASNVGGKGVLNPGDVVDLTQPEVARIAFDPSWAPVPLPTRPEKTVTPPYTLVLGDFGLLVHSNYSSPGIITLPASPTLGWYVEIVDDIAAVGSGNNTQVNPNTGQAFAAYPQVVHVKTADKGNAATIGPDNGTIFCVPVVAGDLVLLGNQTDKTQNGIYVIPSSSTAVSNALRDPANNVWATLWNQIVIVDHGDNDNFYFDGSVVIQTTGGQIVIGVTQLVYAIIQFSGHAFIDYRKRQIGFYWNGVGWVAF